MRYFVTCLFVAVAFNTVATESKKPEKSVEIKKNVSINFDVIGGVAVQNIGEENCVSVSSIDSSVVGGNVKLRTNVKGLVSITNVGDKNSVSIASIGGSSCQK
jgi:hypothetical protein